MLQLREFLYQLFCKTFIFFAPVKFKNWMEYKYWKRRHDKEGELKNNHYEYFYTSFFGLSRNDYIHKKILDIGCGPRGSLEWISSEAECVGIDPLIDKYYELGIDKHKMKYVNSSAENIPFPDGYFDIVTTFNNLDHVDDVNKAIEEIKRVVAKGGTLLLITEVEHDACPTEPHNLSRLIAHQFEPEFMVVQESLCAIREDHDVYQSLRDNLPFIDGKEGIAFAKLIRV